MQHPPSPLRLPDSHVPQPEALACAAEHAAESVSSECRKQTEKVENAALSKIPSSWLSLPLLPLLQGDRMSLTGSPISAADTRRRMGTGLLQVRQALASADCLQRNEHQTEEICTRARFVPSPLWWTPVSTRLCLASVCASSKGIPVSRLFSFCSSIAYGRELLGRDSRRVPTIN
jgi:hypothetical protein